MNKIEDTFRNTVTRLGLIKKKDKLILGISGGPDSIYLLHLVCRLKDEYKLHIVCAHFNHKLRDEADQEEQFVKKVCKTLGVNCLSESKPVKKFFTGDSLEQTARALRFDFFLNCSRQTKIKKIALAHHKDDLVETVLMRIVRGSGLRGLRGFLPRTRFKSLNVVRPLVEIRKNEITNWLKKEKVPYCTDKSNFDDKFLRNRLRLKILPLLEEINPNIVDNLCNMAETVGLDYDFLYRFSRDCFQSLKRRETKADLRLDLEGLKKLPKAVYNNVIRIAIEQLKGNMRRIESRHIDEVNDLIVNRPRGSIVDLPSLSVRKDEDYLYIKLVNH